MKILVVEDDAKLAALLKRIFREEGHEPAVAGSLKAAAAALARGAFDLVLLDWMLPDGEGLSLCALLRGRQPPTPVIILTARGEVQDRIGGLRAGADDYIVKPFEIGELLARVAAVHGRASRWARRLGPLEIDFRRQLVTAGGRRIDLTSREYALLVSLADADGGVMSRAALYADVWNLRFDPGSGLVDVLVSRLRDKLGEHAWLIETVRGQGYRLRADDRPGR